MVSNIFLYHEDYSSIVRSIWDVDINGDIEKVNPSKYDKIEYSWVCPICGKRFKSRPLAIARMIDKGFVSCKECSKGFSLPQKGCSLEDVYPELVQYWDYSKNGYLKPSMIRPNSNKKVWWVCSDCGRSYLRSPNTQVDSKGLYCSSCYNSHKKFKYGSLGGLYN